MNAEELVQQGRLDEALEALQLEVRKRPGDEKLRVFLFQLNCVLGRFEKAVTQLQVIANLNAETMLLAQIFRQVISCELLRQEVFAGGRAPVIFGEPEEWIGWLVQANSLASQGQWEGAAELRDKAFDAAPETAGKCGETAFSWIGDADPRLGPVLEAFIDGKYYWVPFCRLKVLAIEKPSDLRDLVWISASFTWTNGGTASGFIPVRYAGTEAATDAGLRLSRKTEWTEKPAGYSLGLGQRTLATNETEIPLLQAGTIQMETT